MRLADRLLSLIYGSFFVASDAGYRQAHFLSKVAFILSIALYVAKGPGRAYVLPLIILLGLIYPGKDWATSVLKLSVLVGAVTTLVTCPLLLLGANFYPLQVLEVVVKAVNTTSAIAFSFMIISPTELHNALYLLRGKKVATLPLVLWVLVPRYLKDLLDSLALSRLKYPKAKRNHKVSSVAIASQLLEVNSLFEEYCYWRLRTSVKVTIGLERSYKYTLILLAVTLLLTLLQYI